MKKLICKILGHEWDCETAEIYNEFYCNRCHHHECYEPPDVESISYRIALVIFKVKRRYYAFKLWCRPCSDCGRRFGQHDETKEHLPF